MSCRRNVLSTKCFSTKKISTKCLVDEMFFDEMYFRQNAFLQKYFDEMSCRRNVFRRNAFLPKKFDKNFSTKLLRRKACRLKCRSTNNIAFDARDRTNSAYYLNSYAVDFFNHDSEASLILENQINLDETNNLLFDFSLMFSSIKTSLEIIIRNENEQATTNDIQCCQPLYEKMSHIKEIFAEKFYKAYPYTKRH